MNAEQIVDSLKHRKGRHVAITWRRSLKTLKTCQDVIEKQTTAHVRAGIDYANLASVKEGIATGERDEVQPLPTWQEWAQPPFILRHKSNGTEYVRLYPASFGNLVPVVAYFRNGVATTKEAVRADCYASEFDDSGDGKTVFNVKAASVLSIAD